MILILEFTPWFCLLVLISDMEEGFWFLAFFKRDWPVERGRAGTGKKGGGAEWVMRLAGEKN